jgi:hypothetical protein
MTKRTFTKNVRPGLASAVVLILLLCLTVKAVYAEENTSKDTALVAELKKKVEESHGYKLQVYVVTNPESKLQDLYIMPESGKNYETKTFVYAILGAVNRLTTEIIAYRIYIGVVLIDINGELFAISAKNAREVMSLEAGDERDAKLNIYLKKLR